MVTLKLLPVLYVLLIKSVNSQENSFNNVKIVGYSVFVKKFEQEIISSNSLSDSLPKSAIFDRIDIINQQIPILYEDAIKDIDFLDELLIENDNLKEIQPGAIKNMPQLRKLSLKNNSLVEIKAGVFNNLKISSLDLSGNKITTISSNALNDLTNLLNINLADNQISNWNSEWFYNTPLLSRISLQNNLITELNENAFKNLQGDKHYFSLPLTLNVVLSYNKITNISPNALKNIKNINNLWLDNNLLKTFDGKCIETLNVVDLRLDGNQLKCFDDGNFQKIFKANTTHLDGNPFECSCLENVIDWIKKNKKHVEMTYAKLNCDAERIKKKMVALEDRLKELKQLDEKEP